MTAPRPFTIRRATAADVTVIARHRAAMFRDMGDLPEEQAASLIAATTELLGRMIPAAEYVGWLACRTGSEDVIAGAGAQLRTLLPRPLPGRAAIRSGPEAIILNVYTEPAWRRRGVARALMEEAIAWTRERGVARLVLHASPDGRPLYERLGFVPTNEMRYAPSSA